MRTSELMRRRANMSMLDLGRIESDLEAIGEISQKEIWPFILPACVIWCPPPQIWPTYELRNSAVWLLPISTHALPFHKLQTPMHVQLIFWSVSLWHHLLCTFHGLLRTQQGSVSTEEFVRKTDWVPLMSVLLLFNITTEHTWNSRHGAAPFDM